MRRGGLALLLLATLLLGAAPARAQEPASRPAAGSRAKEVTLEEVVVTGDPEEGASLRRVSRKEIERAHAQTAVEILEREPSLHATTGSRGERIFTFRGFEQRQIVVLLDGAPAYVPYDGQADTGYLPAELIDHVTIVKGPASVLYGPNGLGGAVNIVTRRPGSGPLFGVATEVGRGGSLLVSGVHAERLGRLGYSLFAGLRRRDDYPLPASFEPLTREDGGGRENSDSLLYHAGASLELSLPRGHTLTSSLAYVDGERGIPPGLYDPIARFWRFTVWRSVGASFGHSARYLGGALEVDELFYLRLYDNLLDSYDDASYTTQRLPRAYRNWYHDQIWGGRIRLRGNLERTPWGRTQLRLWAGVQHDRHDEQPSSGLITRSLLTVAPEAEAFLGERWSLTAAFQTDVEIPGAATANEPSSRVGLGPLLSLRFEPREGLALQATAARRTRFPTLKDRYSSNVGSRLPNPALRPENAWHLGLDASLRLRRWLLLGASVYDAEVADFISLVTTSGGSQLQNLSGARLLGAELSLELTPLRWLGLRVGYNLVHARRSEAVDGSDELEYRPAHKLALELGVRPLRWLELSTLVRVVGSRAYQHPASGLWQALEPYAVWDAQVNVRPTRWLALWLRARNLLDASFESQYGFPEPGRELWAGLRVTYERGRGD
jgi:iron complex outermembrane receptor protein